MAAPNAYASERHRRKLERMKAAVSMSGRGLSQYEIAAELQVSQVTIHRLLREAEEETLRDATDEVLRQKIRQTRRLETLYREAMEAWEKSKQDRERRSTKQRGKAGKQDSESTEYHIVVESSPGDVSFLNLAVGIQADIRKIWGLDAPVKLQHQAPGADITDLSRLSTEELRAYKAMLAKMEGRADDDA